MTMLSNKMTTLLIATKEEHRLYSTDIPPCYKLYVQIISSERQRFWESYQKFMGSDIKCTNSV